MDKASFAIGGIGKLAKSGVRVEAVVIRVGRGAVLDGW